MSGLVVVRRLESDFFSEVEVRECFLYEDELYIKSKQQGDFNCMNLETGSLHFMQNDFKVYKVECRIEIFNPSTYLG